MSERGNKWREAMKNNEYTWATIKANEDGEYFFSESSKYDGGREPEVTFVVKRNLLNNIHVDVNDIDKMQEIYLHGLNTMTEVHVELLKENDQLQAKLKTAEEALKMFLEVGDGCSRSYLGKCPRLNKTKESE